MIDFIHVDCPVTRAVLEGRDISSRAIMRAARFTDACQSEDYKSQHITDCVFAARETAVVEMWITLQEREGCFETHAVNAMRNFWSI